MRRDEGGVVTVRVIDALIDPTDEMAQLDDKTYPSPIYQHGVFVYLGEIYLFGGLNFFMRSGSLHRFDKANSRWVAIQVPGKSPEPTNGHTTCSAGNKMYMFGGWTDAYTDSLWVLHLDPNPELWRWEQCETQRYNWPTPCTMHSADIIGNDMFVYGGYSEQGQLAQFYALNLTTLQWRYVTQKGSVTPGCRSCHASCTYGNKLYITGGGNDDFDLYCYDLDTGEWTVLKTCTLIGLSSRKLLGYSNKIWLFSPDHANLLYYDLETRSGWHEMKITPRVKEAAASDCTVSRIGNQIFVIGGRSPCQDILVYHIPDTSLMPKGTLLGLCLQTVATNRKHFKFVDTGVVLLKQPIREEKEEEEEEQVEEVSMPTDLIELLKAIRAEMEAAEFNANQPEINWREREHLTSRMQRLVNLRKSKTTEKPKSITPIYPPPFSYPSYALNSEGSDEEGDEEWSCTGCTYLNAKGLEYCQMCQTPNPLILADFFK